MAESTHEPWDDITEVLRKDDARQLSEFIEGLSPSETARAVSRLDDDSRKALLLLLTPEEAADVLHELPERQAASLIEEIQPEAAAAIIDEMPGDEQANILADLEAAGTEAILDAMPRQSAEETRRLMAYPEDTAGGIMNTDYLSYRERMTVSEVLEDLQARNDKYSDYEVQYGYVISNRGSLRGVLRMRDLLLSPRSKAVVRS